LFSLFRRRHEQWRRLAALAATVLALVCMLQSGDRWSSYTHFVQVQTLKDRWHDEDTTPHDRELNQGFKLAHRAIETDKSNADYRLVLASLHAWRERGLRLWPEQARAETEKVIEGLKAALVRRPSWFEAWILLALVKFQSGDIDHELSIALEKAIETGRYETVVHYGLGIVAPKIWDRLSGNLRMKAKKTLNTALENREVNRLVVESIVMSGKEELFEEKFAEDAYLSRLRKQYVEKRKNSS